MNILIIGAGAIGIALGASLAERNSISFIASEKTAAAIKKYGVSRGGIFGDIVVLPERVRVFENYVGLPENFFDFVLICSKTMANKEIAEKLSAARVCMAQNCKIIILQNGWGNDLPYLEFFDKSVVYNARVITGFMRTAPNKSEITVHNSPILIGSLHGADKAAVKELADEISRGGIPTEASDEIEEALWAKMLYNTTLNPLSAILHTCYGDLTKSEYSLALMHDMINETYAVMNAANYKTFWESADEYEKAFLNDMIPKTAAHHASTLQDIEKKQKTEIDTMNGCIINLGRKYGVCVQTHEFIYKMIKTIEDLY